MNEFSYILQQKAGFYFFLASCYSKIKIDMETPPTLCVGCVASSKQEKGNGVCLQQSSTGVAEGLFQGKHSVELFEWKPHEPA